MSSIPLVALQGGPWQAPDTPLEAYSRVAQLNAMRVRTQAEQQQTQQSAQSFPLEQQAKQQQVQAQQMQIEAAKRAQQEQQTLTQLQPKFSTKDDSGKVTGYDWDGYYNAALQSGVSPETVQAKRSQQLDFTQKLAAADKTKQDAEEARFKKLYDIFEGVKSVKDPVQRQQAYLQSLPRINALGYDVGKLPTQVPDDAALEAMEAPFGQHAQMLADAKTRADIADKLRGDVGQQELSAYLQNPDIDKGIKKDAATFLSWKAKQNPQMLVMGNMLGKAGEGSALDQAAERYSQSGELPSGLARSPGSTVAIIRRAAELHPEANLAGNKAIYASNKKALGSLQDQFSKVSAFESTAGKNLDVFLQQAEKVTDLGAKFADVPIRTVQRNVLGTADIAAFDAARTTALTEIAKVLNSPTGAGVLSDSARHEVEQLIGPNATLNSIKSAAKILKQDMANRHESYQAEIKKLQEMVASPSGESKTGAGSHKVGDTITQKGKNFKVTAVDANGKITAADPL